MALTHDTSLFHSLATLVHFYFGITFTLPKPFSIVETNRLKSYRVKFRIPLRRPNGKRKRGLKVPLGGSIELPSPPQ